MEEEGEDEHAVAGDVNKTEGTTTAGCELSLHVRPAGTPRREGTEEVGKSTVGGTAGRVEAEGEVGGEVEDGGARVRTTEEAGMKGIGVGGISGRETASTEDVRTTAAAEAAGKGGVPVSRFRCWTPLWIWSKEDGRNYLVFVFGAEESSWELESREQGGARTAGVG